MAGRKTTEWIGKTPDSAVPPRVRLRIFEAYGGRCAMSGRRIGLGVEWHLDHKTPLADGGEHRETNLQPVIAEEHRKKTSAEATARAKARRLRKKDAGIKTSKRRLPGSRGSEWKQKIGGKWVRREEG